MPDGASPEPEKGAQVVEAVFHPNPVSIPAGALREPPVRPPAFGPTFMIGSCASIWLSAALVTGDPVPILASTGWLLVLALDLRVALRRA